MHPDPRETAGMRSIAALALRGLKTSLNIRHGSDALAAILSKYAIDSRRVALTQAKVPSTSVPHCPAPVHTRPHPSTPALHLAGVS
eukprot:65839-Chlamydomonas_euryale.AAC.5